MAADVIYRIPFCPSSEINFDQSQVVTSTEGDFNVTSSNATATVTTTFPATTQRNISVTLWRTLSSSCQVATIVVASVAAVLLVFNLFSNILMVAASFYIRPKPLKSKGDRLAMERTLKFRDSLQIQAVFRISLAISGIITSGLLLPFIAINAYELFSSSVYDESSAHQPLLAEYKKIACSVFHIALSSSIYSMLGAVMERWITTFGLDPTDYLEKSSNPVVAPKTKDKTREDKSKPPVPKSTRRTLAFVYLILSWCASIALGVLSVSYRKIRFLLYGEDLRGENFEYFSAFVGLVKIPAQSMLPMSIIYILFIYVPLVLLVLSLIATLCYLFKVQSIAENLDSYQEACHRSSSYHHKKMMSFKYEINHDRVREVERSQKDAEYSHKTEHEQQVTLNCQETGFTDIQTDCIQMQCDQPASSGADLKAPLPPDWLKFSSLNRRYSNNSTVQVLDLATTPLPVSIDSARSYFGETTETRAALVYTSTSSLLLLPVCALLAIDVFAGKESIFARDTLIGFNAENAVSVHTSSSLAVAFLAIYVFGGSLPFWLLCFTSRLFKRAVQRVLCSRKPIKQRPRKAGKESAKTKHADKPTKLKRSDSAPGAQRRPSEVRANVQNRLLERHSRSLGRWQPEARPASGTLDYRMDIDARFAIDAEN